MKTNVYPLKQLYLLLGLLVLVLAWSAANEHFVKWLLLSIWVLAGIPLLIVVFRRFAFTPVTYLFIFFHACILLVGAHYTYQKVPFGFWMQDLLALGRNPFDRVGHFAQGFVPALIIREILLRRSPLISGKWLFFLVLCVAMAVSMIYEFIEWWTAVSFPQRADPHENAALFLAKQGDPWDTQWDMLMATIGAALSQWLLSGVQDRQLQHYRLVNSGRSAP